MPDTRQMLEQAVAHQRAGAAARAEELYRAVLAADPEHPDALHLLGVLRLRAGAPGEAEALIRRAIAQRHAIAPFHNNLGNALLELGRPDEARASYTVALQLQPDYALAHVNLGNVQQRLGALEAAAVCHARALALDPRLVPAHVALGNVRSAQGRHAESVEHHRAALAVDPHSIEAARGIGDALAAQGKTAEAIGALRAALVIAPNDAPTLTNLGNALRVVGELAAAIDCHTRACAALPGSALPQLGLGAALQDLGHYERAAAAFARAAELDPRSAEAWHNLGAMRALQGEVPESIHCLRNAFALDPGQTATLAQLVNQLQHACEWQDLVALEQRLLQDFDATPGAVVPPFVLMSVPCDAATQLEAARRHATALAAPLGTLRASLGFAHAPAPRERLRIGYLSADFNEHAVAYMVAEVLERHDRARVAVIGCSYGHDDGSATRRRIVAACDRFLDLRALPHGAAARAIHAEGVDILVDLTGYTRHARPEIMALRPAPVQAQWMGYPGTYGAAWCAWALVDRVVLPPDEAVWFTEQPAYLPCFWVNDTSRPVAAPPTRSQAGLPEDAFVFCCFNQSYKIRPEVFATWLRLLRAVPGSVLWLRSSNATATANLRDRAVAAGVDADRLIFAPPVPMPDHAARLGCADLALDTLPYNGHATSCDALWAGVPIVTQAGRTFAGRVTAAQLAGLGLETLTTTTAEDYEALALRLATHPDERSALRAKLAAARHAAPLFDTGRFARTLEDAYSEMWKYWLERGAMSG